MTPRPTKAIGVLVAALMLLQTEAEFSSLGGGRCPDTGSVRLQHDFRNRASCEEECNSKETCTHYATCASETQCITYSTCVDGDSDRIDTSWCTLWEKLLTGTPTAAPTVAATWATGVAADNETVYKCSGSSNQCYLNTKTARHTWAPVAAPDFALATNSALTTSDGSWEITVDAMSFTATTGAVKHHWPFECACSA